MGLFMYLYLSPTVTQEEWEPVYEETLELAKRMQFCNLATVEHRGSGHYVQKLVEETRSKTWGTYWCADGTLSSMHTSESYTITRNLGRAVLDDSIPSDPIMISHQGHSHLMEHFRHVFGGDKFCSYDFAEQLFGIAAVIDARLGGRTYVYGNIDMNNAIDGVRRINKILKEMGKKPVSLPTYLVPEMLLKRVVALDTDEDSKLDILWNIAKDYDMRIPESFHEYFSAEKCLEYALDPETGEIGNDPEYIHNFFGEKGIRTLIDNGKLDGNLYKGIVSHYLYSKIYYEIDGTNIHEFCSLVAALDPKQKAHCLTLFREHPEMVEEIIEKEMSNAMKLKEEIDRRNYVPGLHGTIGDYFLNMLKINAYDPKDLGPGIITSPYKLHLYKKGQKIMDYLEKTAMEFYSGCLEEAFEGEAYQQFTSVSHSDKVQIILSKTQHIPEALFHKVASKLERPNPDYDRYWPFVTRTSALPSARAVLVALAYNDELYAYMKDKVAKKARDLDETK